ncbi:MAG: hypothetical protein HDS18_03555 [Bacteroides sp.]|nr:hypothetical protein [Bacteroides sp.]
MRKILQSVIALCCVCLSGWTATENAMASGVVPTLYGNQIYARSWGEQDASKAGIYRFRAEENAKVEAEFHPEKGNIYSNGGAVYVDGRFYSISYTPVTGKAQKNTLTVYNTSGWTLESQKEIPTTSIASDLTYCPVDKKVYGIFLNATGSGYLFGTLDLSDGSVNKIKDLTLRDGSNPLAFVAIAANTEGDVFAISAKGDLYSFDRSTGEPSMIGSTGFVPARWNQSGCFDFTTKEMYWAACNADLSALLKVDTATGKATRVLTFTDDEEFVGLYSESSDADLQGPQEVSNLSLGLEGSSLNGILRFTLPSTSISGAPISGTLDYTVTDNGDKIIEAKGQAGSEVSHEVVFSEGLHTLAICAVSAAGQGATLRHTVYAGNDVPRMPASVKAVLNGESVAISWEAVASGAHGGYVDPAAITYTVTRRPDGVVVAENITTTNCADEKLPMALGDYTYEVTANFAGISGEPGVSASVALGQVLTPPYKFDFTKEEQFKFCTVIDANEDNTTWSWSVNGAQCRYHKDNASDDWLITPAFSLKAGNEYIIVLMTRAGRGGTPETFRLMAGSAPTVEAMTVPVIADGAATANTAQPVSVVFTPEIDGVYHFGIQGTSPKYQYGLYMYSLEIGEPIAKGAPVASESVKAEAVAEGALEATVTAVAPLKAVDGSDLASLTKAEFMNITTGELAGTVENPAPGSSVSITDKAPVNGVNEYSVAFFNKEGKGYSATTSVYVGEDLPGEVTDVTLRQNGEKAVLTWTAPTEGVNGGYINPANLTYRVVLTANSGDVARDLKECSYTDDEQSMEGQHYLQYTVFVSNAAGESKGVMSNGLTFGTPYSAPFAESFKDGKEMMTPWTTEKEGTGYCSWTPSTKGYDGVDYSQDGDFGWVTYSSKGAVSLISPLIDLSGLKTPVMKFWMVSPDGPVDLKISASSDQGITWTELKSLEADCKDWELCAIDLGGFADKDKVQVKFRANTNEYNDMRLDNIRIADSKKADLAIMSFSGPETIDAGATGEYTVRILNDGANTASGYTVSLYGNDKLLASSEGAEIAADATAEVAIEVAIPINFNDFTLIAEVKYDGDEDSSNDEMEFDITVTEPRLPVISTLSATTKGQNAVLSWSKPATERNPSAKTDDLESLTAWEYGNVDKDNHSGNIGDYKVYDEDGKSTVIVSTWAKQPNGQNPMAFQVGSVGSYPDLNLSTYGVNAHSGSKSFIAWGASEEESSDWLILPELFPGETSISFWAHAASDSYGVIPDEKLEILYSTTGTDISDFKVHGEALPVPSGMNMDPENGFVKFEATLPSDAKYAAIRTVLSTTRNKAIVIDDITFTGASFPMETLTIVGYNIYRDGEKIATSDKEEYVDAAPVGDHTYNVTTVYDLGESRFSNEVFAATSGVESLTGVEEGSPRYFNLQGLEVKKPMKGEIYVVVYPDGTSCKEVIRDKR